MSLWDSAPPSLPLRRRNVMKPICGCKYENAFARYWFTRLLWGHFLGALWWIDTLVLLKKMAKQTCEISFCAFAMIMTTGCYSPVSPVGTVMVSWVWDQAERWMDGKCSGASGMDCFRSEMANAIYQVIVDAKCGWKDLSNSGSGADNQIGISNGFSKATATSLWRH